MKYKQFAIGMISGAVLVSIAGIIWCSKQNSEQKVKPEQKEETATGMFESAGEIKNLQDKCALLERRLRSMHEEIAKLRSVKPQIKYIEPAVPEETVTANITNRPAAIPTPTREQFANRTFDHRMEHAFNSLQEREQKENDPRAILILQELQDKIARLDDIRNGVADGTAQAKDLQVLMGEIISLSRQDRNMQLVILADQLGIENPEDQSVLISEFDRIGRDTKLDWAQLFNRIPPPQQAP